MPPRKRNTTQLKIGFGAVESAILECLVQLEGGSVARHVRRAVRYYGQHAPAMSQRGLMKNLRARVEASDWEESLKQEVLADIRAFLERKEVLPGEYDPHAYDDLAWPVDSNQDFKE